MPLLTITWERLVRIVCKLTISPNHAWNRRLRPFAQDTGCHRCAYQTRWKEKRPDGGDISVRANRHIASPAGGPWRHPHRCVLLPEPQGETKKPRHREHGWYLPNDDD